MKPYHFVTIPPSRIATFDVVATGLTKHHVTAMLEFDVTESRRMCTQKPVVDNEIKIREILNMTVLIDHDVIDGAPMVRFLNELTMKMKRGRKETNIDPEMQCLNCR